MDEQLDALFHIINAGPDLSLKKQERQEQVRTAHEMLETFIIKMTNRDDVVVRYIEALGGRNRSRRVIHLLDILSRKADPVTMTPAIGRAVIRWFGHVPASLTRLAVYSKIRNDPEVRAHLLRSTSWQMAWYLLIDGRPDEFARLFRLVAFEEPGFAAVALESYPDVAEATLDVADLLPLLQSENRQARLKAITFLGKSVRKGSPPRQPSDTRGRDRFRPTP